SGLVLAVFLGTMVGALVPAVNATESTPTAGALSNILIGQVGLPAAAGQKLIGGIGAIPGATVFPLYVSPQQQDGTSGGSSPNGGGQTNGANQRGGGQKGNAHSGHGPVGGQGNGGNVTNPKAYYSNMVVVSCASMRAIEALGQCAPGLTAVQTIDVSLFDDNPKDQTKPFVSAANQGYNGDLTKLGLQSVLVKVNSSATLERVRTYLALNAPPRVGGGYGSSPTPPRTFGETLQIRIARAVTFERIMYAMVALTLIVAGCSLAVTVGGGLVDRKRPFTLLRVGGTPVSVLSRVVLLEAAVPLVAATLVAAGIAYGTSVLAFLRLAPKGTAIPQLGRDYYTIMGIGLVVACCVIAVTLPLLRRMT
ncbi:MAG: FtsX-like permease family protein, partial [Trebonia sp.]